MSYKPSKYQSAIYAEYQSTSNNIFIKAGPGAGKSSVLLEILKRTPFYKKSILLAFNKSIAEELKSKVPAGVTVSTVHSMAYKTLLQNTSNKYKLQEIKTFILAKKIIPDYFKDKKNGKKMMNVYLFTISRLYDLYRMNLANKTEDDLRELGDEYNVDYSPKLITDTIKVIDYIEKYNNKSYTSKEMMIDFTDMLWLTYYLVNSSNFTLYDVVLCDEFQDVNPLQRELILKLIHKKGRFIFCGDEKQAIYSFMGSNLLSFNKLQEYPNTTVLPLSVCYRCGSNIIERANEIFPGMEAFEGNSEGIIRNGNLSEIKQGDMLLCRNNLPLVETFLNLLEIEKKSYIMGRDFGIALCNLIDKVNHISDLDILLNQKIQNLKDRGIENPLNHKSYISLSEKIMIIKILINKKDFTLQEVSSLFKTLFKDNSNDNSITLSTIHKAKGLEADRVFLLGYDSLLPSQYAQTELELRQEKCLQYVALTRAKKELIFISYTPN